MATLKESNQKAVEYFKDKGKKFLILKGLEEFQLEEQELGDLEVAQIRKWAGITREKMGQGLEAIQKEQKFWETQVKDLYGIMQDAKSEDYAKKTGMSETEMAQFLNKTRIQYEESVRVLNLCYLFENILSSLNRSQTQAQSYLKLVKETRNNIIEAIKSNNFDKLNAETANFAEYYNKLGMARDGYAEALEAYNKITVKDIKALSFFPFTDAEIKEFYYETQKGLVKAQEANDKKAEEAIKLNIEQMSTIVGTTSSVALIEEAQKRVTAETEAARKAEEERIQKEKIQAFEKSYSQDFETIYQKALEMYKSQNWNNEYFSNALNAAEEQLVALDVPENLKNSIRIKYLKDLEKRINEFYGIEQFSAMLAVRQINNKILRLNELKLDDPKLKEEYDRIPIDIKTLLDSDIAKKVHLTIAPEGDTFEFRFQDPKVGNFKLEPIRKDIVEKFTPKKQEPVQPVQPQPVQPVQPVQPQPVQPIQPQPVQPVQQVQPAQPVQPVAADDLKYYIGLLETTNARVQEVNNINNLLISHNRLNDLSLETISQDVNAEVRAEVASAAISRLRLELSEKRYDYLKKYGKYIIAEPEVKGKKIEEIQFNANFEEFVNDRDNLIADAEVKILELNKDKPDGYEKEVAELMKFIKTQNSLISRFLVSESISRKIDIIAFQKQRLQNRTAIIEARKAAMGQGLTDGEPVDKPEPIQPVQPEPVQPVQPEPKKEPVQKDLQVVKYKEASLKFNPRNSREVAYKVQEGDVLFKNNPPIVIKLIENGVRVGMSKQLRERLAELNAKISLVNNKVKQSRTSKAVDANAEEQDIAFKEKHDVGFDDYSVEIRIPGKNKSQVLYAEEVPTEEHHRSR